MKRLFWLPCANVSRRDDCGAWSAGRARQVVLHVHVCLNILGKLDHHYVCHSVTILGTRLYKNAFFYSFSKGQEFLIFRLTQSKVLTFSVPQSGNPLTPGILSV